jgi:hypothetical protein
MLHFWVLPVLMTACVAPALTDSWLIHACAGESGLLLRALTGQTLGWTEPLLTAPTEVAVCILDLPAEGFDCCGWYTGGAGRISILKLAAGFACTPGLVVCCGRYTGGAGRVSVLKLLAGFSCTPGLLVCCGR